MPRHTYLLGRRRVRLDSWSTDGHKLLNVPYDSGIAICRNATALRSLGRNGVAALVDRTIAMARLFAVRLADSGRAEVVNDVVANQVLVRWLAPDGDHGRRAEEVMAAIRAEGTAFFSGTTYRGERLMRISVSDWATDEADVERVVAALLAVP